MRTGPKLPAGCLTLFALEGLHFFDGERVWEIFFSDCKNNCRFREAELLQSLYSQFIVNPDWLKKYPDS